MSLVRWAPGTTHFKHEQPSRRALKAMQAVDEEKHRKEVKAAVWKRDGGKCRVCGDAAQEMHELEFRSLGGKRSLENSIAVCAFGSRHNCHRLLQKHEIEVQGENANKRLVFTWADYVPKKARTFQILSKRRSQRKD
jgi:5-methylcytosine-specific restriction endonuclease McrA